MKNESWLDQRPQRSRRRTRGAAVVEFAIVAPVFVLFVFGLVEYGRMVMVQQVITNATREGARSAVVEGATEQDAKDTVVEFCTAAGIPATEQSVSVSADPQAAAVGDPITVSVSVPYASVSWLPAPMYLANKQLAASTAMRKESSQ